MLPRNSFLALAIALNVAVSAFAADLDKQPGYLRSEFLYDTAPFKSCHASTIEQATNGPLVAAWFGGTREGHDDVGIWLARSIDGKWTKPIEVANGLQYMQADGTPHRHPCWNPVLFQPRSGPLMLFYKVGPSPSKWWGMLTTSTDGGATWSEPRRLPEQIDGPVKNKPLQLASGEILCGSSTEHDGWRVHFERTRDFGRTWQRTSPVNDGRQIGAIQPSILALGGDKLLAIGRTQQKHLFEVASSDGGKTWATMKLGTLPNPSSGTDALTAKDGRHFLVYNHTPSGRSPLHLAVSSDGTTWETALVLEDEPKAEFSYPAIIQTADGLLHITYTWKRQKVKHVVVDPTKLTPRALSADK